MAFQSLFLRLVNGWANPRLVSGVDVFQQGTKYYPEMGSMPSIFR